MTNGTDVVAYRPGGAGQPGASVATDGSRLACTGVTVNFGGIVAVDDVDLSVPPSSIVGLVGPNGAGKSTLFGVLSGLIRPTRGRVFLGGEDVTGSRPQRRAEMGLARTFQHPELFSGLTARDHLVIAYRAKHHRRRVWTDLFTMGSLHRSDPRERDCVDELIELLGLSGIANRMASGLPLGLARMLELGRALAATPTVLLLDEPSSGLDSNDTEQFEKTLSRVASERGISVLLVEHDVDLVMRMCSTVNVLDFGRLIATGTPAHVRADKSVRAAYLGEEPTEASPDDVGQEPLISGAVTARPARPDSPDGPEPEAGPPILRVEGLGVRYGDATALSDVSFDVAPGTALAVLGANGAGKSSMARAVSGLVRPCSGRIFLNGTDVTGWPAYRMREQGVLHLPEGKGVFRTLTVTENMKMAVDELDGRQARREATDRAFEIFPLLAARRHKRASLLSGGEQQMLSLARALITSPTILVADEMSLGLAPIMVEVVFDGLTRARNAGVTVVMIEQYVHRALSFADQCLVLERGQVAWSGPTDAAKDEVLGHYLGEAAMMTGA